MSNALLQSIEKNTLVINLSSPHSAYTGVPGCLTGKAIEGMNLYAPNVWTDWASDTGKTFTSTRTPGLSIADEVCHHLNSSLLQPTKLRVNPSGKKEYYCFFPDDTGDVLVRCYHILDLSILQIGGGTQAFTVSCNDENNITRTSDVQGVFGYVMNSFTLTQDPYLGALAKAYAIPG